MADKTKGRRRSKAQKLVKTFEDLVTTKGLDRFSGKTKKNIISKIIKFAGEKGKKAAEEKFGVKAVRDAQATMSKRKPVTTGKKEKLFTLDEGFKKTDPNYYRTRQTTPELTGKDLDFGYDPIAPKIKKQGSGFGQKGGVKGSVRRKAGGKVMSGSELVASLYD